MMRRAELLSRPSIELPMTPSDVILLLLSVGFAGLALAAHGATIHGLGPAALALIAGGWQCFMQWLRRRHRDSHFTPGTQQWVMLAAVGWSLGMLVAVIWAARTLPPWPRP
jgi:hypothetical protein